MTHADDPSTSEPPRLADIVVANLHRRFTGVSRTVAALVPEHRKSRAVTVIDSGGLGLGGTMGFWSVLRRGWQRPRSGGYRVFHARRDVEMIAGLVLRAVPGQRWRVVFTSAAPKRPGRLLRFLINRMDAVIATSARSAGFLDWHSVIVPHGVDPVMFQPTPDRSAALAEAGYPGKRAVGIFGRVRPSKGTDLFVSALVRVLPDHPDWIAVVSGLCQEADRPFLEAMKAEIAAAGLEARIVFLGDQDEAGIRAWYQRVSICVAASRREGFGLTPLEAFASGATAVTSGAGAWPGLVTEDIGRRFRTGDADSLADALAELMAQPDAVDALGRAARHAAETRLSIAAEAAAINAVYETLGAGTTMPRLGPPDPAAPD